MSAYDDLIGGSLKLKSKGAGIKKKKSKKSKKEAKESRRHSGDEAEVTKFAEEDTGTASASSTSTVPTRTKAEARFEEIQRKRKMEKIDKLASKSHRQRVAELNDYLESLSQHYDIPKALAIKHPSPL
ncbi:hypothetical protein IWQ60_008576 [Tieghemiomyces parasiticus]|uniref:DUF1754-domain-containing protein n=1 Tax=Tieghemiomyces parasiticus TaxID=78921 RepID=A0A9W7ZW04_9FUNG|nr:hypothetical protein IWQ60_008576 [Tieghemiomyces parasiticus]